jgi:hypothetical protein
MNKYSYEYLKVIVNKNNNTTKIFLLTNEGYKPILPNVHIGISWDGVLFDLGEQGWIFTNTDTEGVHYFYREKYSLLMDLVRYIFNKRGLFL